MPAASGFKEGLGPAGQWYPGGLWLWILSIVFKLLAKCSLSDMQLIINLTFIASLYFSFN